MKSSYCGAIFMANKDTREECLQRKLFGLSANRKDFVLKIKRGMHLFLFDYDNRNLYGVFKASSDGGMNIVRDAYKSKFPAQVRFHVFWECDPLQEDTFSKAITDNYFTGHKFKLGLSRDQVSRLLRLFKETRRNIQPSLISGRCHQKLKNMSSNPERNLPQTGNGECQDVCSLILTETLPKAMPKKLASVVVCDPEMIVDVALKLQNPDAAHISVFQRLAGWPKLIEENRRHEPHKRLAPPLYLMESVNSSENATDTLKRKIKWVNNRGYGEPCKSEDSVIVAGDAVVIKEAPLTESFAYEGKNINAKYSLDDKCQHANPVEMLLAQYEEYLSRYSC